MLGLTLKLVFSIQFHMFNKVLKCYTLDFYIQNIKYDITCGSESPIGNKEMNISDQIIICISHRISEVHDVSLQVLFLCSW